MTRILHENQLGRILVVPPKAMISEAKVSKIPMEWILIGILAVLLLRKK